MIILHKNVEMTTEVMYNTHHKCLFMQLLPIRNVSRFNRLAGHKQIIIIINNNKIISRSSKWSYLGVSELTFPPMRVNASFIYLPQINFCNSFSFHYSEAVNQLRVLTV